MNICIKNLQLIRRYLLAGMLMIQGGMAAPEEAEYSNMSHARRLPDIVSKMFTS